MCFIFEFDGIRLAGSIAEHFRRSAFFITTGKQGGKHQKKQDKSHRVGFSNKNSKPFWLSKFFFSAISDDHKKTSSIRKKSGS